MNGGIGFAINEPCATIEANPASHISIDDLRTSPMSVPELQQLRSALDAFSDDLQIKKGAAISISGAMQTHVGMGSSTAIRLGALEALALVNGRSVARNALVSASGRGGTSGIGINSYFDGGLVCDLGRRRYGSSFSPSSQTKAPVPLALPSVEMPDWPILLCIPRAIRPKTQEEEIAFFARTTPLPAAASFEASYIALFELYAMAAEADFAAFCHGIERMQQTAWKHAERAEYGDGLAFISTHLRDAGAECVGMSSLGPMLFCLAELPCLSGLADVARDLDCEVHLVRPVNRGRAVSLSNA